MFKIDSFLDQKLEKKELWKILTWLYPKWGIIHFVYKLFSKVKTKIDKVSKNPATLAQTTNFGTVAKWYFKNGLEHHLWAISAMHRPFYLKNISCLSGTFKIGKELKNPQLSNPKFVWFLQDWQIIHWKPRFSSSLFPQAKIVLFSISLFSELPKNGYVIFIFFNYCSQIAYQIENIKKVDMTHANFSRGRAKKLLAQ